MKTLLLDFLKFHYKANPFRGERANQKDVNDFLKVREETFPKKVEDPNIVLGLILKLDLNSSTMRSYHWEVTETSKHRYTIDGVHPILSRIYKPNILFIRH